MREFFMPIWSIAGAFTKRFFRDKVAMFFTFIFPLIFLVVFGGLFGGDNQPSFTIGLVNNSQTDFASDFISQLNEGEIFEVTEVESVDAATEQLGRGEFDVIVEVPTGFGEISGNRPTGELVAYYDEADQQLAQTFSAVMNSILDEINGQFVSTQKPLTLSTQTLQTSNLTQFDYTFSGLIGFTILSLSIFGMANGFPSDKKAGYLRRMRSTPLRVSQLLIATGLNYLLIGMISIAVMMFAGIVFFDFQMSDAWVSFILFSAISVIAMFSFGLAIGGWAKNEQQAAPLSNLIAFPLMFLSGVFFPRFLMPDWLQDVSYFLPLTPIIDGLRQIMTEGVTLLDLGSELALITAWAVVVYLIAIRIFRWE